MLTKEEALKLCIDGVDVTPIHSVWNGCRVHFNGTHFIYIDVCGKTEQADSVLTETEWKIYVAPESPKPKFSIDQFVLYEESYYRIIDSEYKHGSHRYFVSPGIYRNTKEDCTIADESELTEVTQ